MTKAGGGRLAYECRCMDNQYRKALQQADRIDGRQMTIGAD